MPLSKWSIVIALATLFWTGEVFSADEDKDPENLAAEFELLDLQGETHRLVDYLENGSAGLWFTNFCGGCQIALPEIGQVFADARTPLLMVSLLGDNREILLQFKEKYDITSPILLDPEGTVCKQYSGAYIQNACPMDNLFLIDASGSIAFRGHYPGMEASELKELIQ